MSILKQWKRCECGKSQPTFNLKGLKAEYCSECKTDDMINVKNKRCHCGKTQPNFNLKGLKAEYCSECKTDEMIDVKSKRKCDSSIEKAIKKHKNIMLEIKKEMEEEHECINMCADLLHKN